MARPKLTNQEKLEKEKLAQNGLRKCRSCKEIKKNENFPKSGNFLKGDCLDCYNKKRRDKGKIPSNKEIRSKTNLRSYYKHKEKRILKAVEYNKKNPDKVKKWAKTSYTKYQEKFFDFKSSLSCSICGYNKHPKAIDFHHLDKNEKASSISKLWRCPNKREKELEKCIPVCSNCHRIIHYEQENFNVSNKKDELIKTVKEKYGL